MTSKEQPNDFDGCFDPMTVDLYSLDPVFDSAAAQQDRFGGDLKPNPNFVGFFQTDRNGNSRGVALDRSSRSIGFTLIHTWKMSHDSKRTSI